MRIEDFIMGSIKVAILLLSFVAIAMATNYVRVCNYNNQTLSMPDPAKLYPEDIDPFLCTHIIYSFAKIGDRHRLNPSNPNDCKMYSRMMALKQRNPGLKILLSVRGLEKEGKLPGKLSEMVDNGNNLRAFIESSINLLRHLGFDGMDLDYSLEPVEKQKFTLLCKELMQAFKEDAEKRREPRLILTATVSPSYHKIERGYEPEKIRQYLDLLNLKAYNFNGLWQKITGHNAPMADDGADIFGRDVFNVPYAVDLWIKLGFPANKIVLGMATFGRTFKLQDERNNGLGAPTDFGATVIQGKYTRVQGILAYIEICDAGFTIVKDNVVKAPYGYKGTAWVGFDDEKSLKYKVQTQIKGKGLAGAVFGRLDYDDFSGNFCKKGKYPLISAVAKELGANIKPTMEYC